MSQLTICLIIFALTVIGFCSGKYSLATVSITSLMALAVTGCLSAGEALAYFSNNNVIMIGGICVVAAELNGYLERAIWKATAMWTIWLA